MFISTAYSIGSSLTSGSMKPLTIIVALYTLLALAAAGRASVQLADDPGRAPFAYGLTAAAAVIYLTGAVLLRRPSPRARAAAFIAFTSAKT